jgi:cytochrome c oxidase assembly factor CtaG
MTLLGGIFLGMMLRSMLPKHHLSEQWQEVVRLGIGLVAMIAALVLGLLIAAAKGSFDAQSAQVKQTTADVILLGSLLAEYGPEALPIRILQPHGHRSERERGPAAIAARKRATRSSWTGRRAAGPS